MSKEYRVSLLDALALLENTRICEDNDVDCNHTADDLITMLKTKFVSVPIEMLESYLYMCNMNREDRKYWHPTGKPFTHMVKEILDEDQEYCMTNNFIIKKRK